MGHPPGPIFLSVPRGRGARVASGCLAVLIVLASGFIALIVTGVLLSRDLDGSTAIVGTAVFGVLPLAIFISLTLLIRGRSKTWIQGTVLVRRGVFGRKATDLAQAPEVYADSTPEYRAVNQGSVTGGGRRVPHLVIWDLAAREWVILSLVMGRGSLLPPNQLFAIADAIAQGERPDPYAERVANTIAWLRSLANDPQARML